MGSHKRQVGTLKYTHIPFTCNKQDLKPQNVLLDAQGTVAKVSDLGMSALITHGYLTHASNMGTFAYAAPELLMGARVSVAADMYSFGVILFQMISGEVPKRGAVDVAVLHGVAHEDVVRLVEACLAHTPVRRPTARQAARLLGKLVEAQAREMRAAGISQGEEEGM